MPWQERDTVSIRLEFVRLASQDGANVRELCRGFQISPKTAYKWLGRYEQSEGDPVSLQDRCRRPLNCRQRSAPELEAAVVRERKLHPSWGGRKIAQRMLVLHQVPLAPSTVTSILHRHGLITPEASQAAAPIQRFEHEQPNALWQMDFSGTFMTLAGQCLPLVVLDDHSRFNLTLTANAKTTAGDIRPQLQEVFRRYGMPARINVDNGPPWGAPSAVEHGLTQLSVWLIRLGIAVSHSRPHHPQTNGKVERFHRTMQQEVLNGRQFADHGQVQRAFDRWRRIYNLERPHDALGLRTPVERYRPSPLRMPRVLPSIQYQSSDTVLRVGPRSLIRFRGNTYPTSNALIGLPVAVRQDPDRDGCFDLYFCHQRFGRLDLRDKPVDT
jgi:transposase InsO family protein